MDAYRLTTVVDNLDPNLQVDIPDPNLRAAIEQVLGIASGGTITAGQMLTLSALGAFDSDISNLAGLEYAADLSSLHLSRNSISDISELAGLTNLHYLDLGDNNISDISALAGLTNLTSLELAYNNISDISALAGLTNLTLLTLGGTNISDISAVAGLPNLTALGLHGDSITDISAVAGLTNLTSLTLGGANISDISAVAGLANLTRLGLYGNNISDISPLAGLTNLTHLWLDQNNISDISALAGLTNLTYLELIGSNIEDLSPLVANTGLGEGDSIYVRGNPLNYTSIYTHIPALRSRGVRVEAENLITTQVVDIPDPNLRGAIESALGIPPGGTITDGQMATLTELHAEGSGISDLTGLEYATNVNHLDLSRNNISDISAVAGLTNLTTLFLSDNNISGISAVAGLTNLTWLKLDDNNISDISPLVATTELWHRDEELSVRGNPLNYASIYTHIPAMQDRGVVELYFDPRTARSIRIVSGDDQQGMPGVALANPFVVEIQDQNGAAFEGVPVTFTVASGGGSLSATSATTDAHGRAESTLTLGPDPGTNSVEVAVAGIQESQTAMAFAELPPVPEDVNRDDVVNILDLVRVASALGTEGADLATDINGDGIVNILDLVMVAGALGNAAAAPSANPRALTLLTATDVGQWLIQVQQFALTDAAAQRSLRFLEQLLAALTPEKTTLLPNYPNPFNPETWIPYQLSESANVTLTIYDTIGTVVRRFDLGHQPAGYYTARTRAAYWDGRNANGEPVASGLYFYQLATPSSRQLRRMVILK